MKEQLRPYAREEQPLTAEGADVVLRPNRAVTLRMVLGELATKAAKFGALSPAGGVLSVTGSILDAAKGPRLRLFWHERRGSPTSLPQREGFGTRLVKRSLAAGLHGTARLDYLSEGLTAVLEFPLLGGEA